MAPLELWFEFASTYSHLAVARVEDAAGEAGVELVWKPFLLGPIFQAQGWKDSPFNLYPEKGRYMWRDLERRSAARGLAFRRPSVFPRNGLLAARIALLAADEGWCGPFARAVFHANFAEDRDIAGREVVVDALRAIGRDERDLERAESPEHKPRLREQTSRAAALGIFGAPTFVVGDELFWGDDRLEDAIAWARRA